MARSYQQKAKVDYYEIFELVAKYNTIKTVLVLIGTLGWEIHHMDIKTAYLNSKLREDVYMKQPTGFVKLAQKYLVCKLDQSLYGLKQ